MLYALKKELLPPTAMPSTCTHSKGHLWTSQGLRVMLQLPEHTGYRYRLCPQFQNLVGVTRYSKRNVNNLTIT